MRLTVLLSVVAVLVHLVTVRAAQVVTFEQLTVSTSSVGITGAVLNPAGQASIQHCTGRLQGAQVRFRWDGTAPTSTVGTPLEIGDILTIDSHEDATRIRFIRTGATDGVLNFHCWR